MLTRLVIVKHMHLTQQRMLLHTCETLNMHFNMTPSLCDCNNSEALAPLLMTTLPNNLQVKVSKVPAFHRMVYNVTRSQQT